MHNARTQHFLNFFGLLETPRHSFGLLSHCFQIFVENICLTILNSFVCFELRIPKLKVSTVDKKRLHDGNKIDCITDC